MSVTSREQQAGGNDPSWAWAPYEPDRKRPWDLARAGHLYRRAAFGASWGQLRQALKDGPQRAVEKLLRPGADVAAFNRESDRHEAAAGSANTLRAWWLRRMLLTPHPLLERMTLFWHSHFATSNVKVKIASLMQRHVELLREHALGRFGNLLQAVFRDPALLLWLGSSANRKARPDVRYARTLVETYTVGPGHASEKDIREAARAFTGWFVLRGELRYIPREHDAGVKRIFAREGRFSGEDVLRILLEHEGAPRFLVRKLYRWLISEEGEPSDTLIAPLVASFSKGYDVAALVERILRSNLFFSPAAYRRRVKSPVEFAVGIIKGLEALVPTARLGEELAALGQNLYHPPTTKGWEGGRRWINHATVLRRQELAWALLSDTEAFGDKLEPLAVAKRQGRSEPERAVGFFLDLFLQGDVAATVREALLEKDWLTGAQGADSADWARSLVHSVVTLPEFQLS